MFRKTKPATFYLALISTSALVTIASAQDAESDVYEQLERFGAVFDEVQKDYVEEVDPKDLVDSAINGMLQSLDPHSSYLGEDDFAEMREDTTGEFGGLGIEVTQEDGVVKVVAPIDDTPAAKLGVQSGDLITHVDGESLIGLNLNEAVDMMRGPIGSTVTITIFREGEDEPFDLEITRDTVKVASAKARAIDNNVYIRLTQFNEQSYPNMQEDVATAIEEIGGMDEVEGFVLDLRNNPGGLLTTAIEVADAFLDRGEIVSTRGRHERDDMRANAKEGDIAEGKPVVVLINGGSASASEIVAGALKDHHRAIIVGTPSFGKGSVQTILPLSPDSAIRLTTARYYTPSGRSIQGLGVEPDVYVEQQPPAPEPEEPKSQAFQDVNEGDLPGALNNDSLSEDEIQQLEDERAAHEESAKIREEDFQLSYALDILHGLSVYDNVEE